MASVKTQVLKNRVFEDGHELFVEYLVNDSLKVTGIHITASDKDSRTWLHDNYETVLEKIFKSLKE